MTSPTCLGAAYDEDYIVREGVLFKVRIFVLWF